MSGQMPPEALISEPGDDHIAPLAPRFLDALRAVEAHDVDGAGEILRGILRVEPRLAEPRMELARLLLETGQLDEAEEHAREALRILEAGGQWNDDLPEGALLSLCVDLLGEILRQRADADEVVFGDPEVWKALMNESIALFRRAHQLDPENEHAASMILGLDPGEVSDDAADETDEEEGANDPPETSEGA